MLLKCLFIDCFINACSFDTSVLYNLRISYHYICTCTMNVVLHALNTITKKLSATWYLSIPPVVTPHRAAVHSGRGLGYLEVSERP